jgi:hypothetical protein
MTTFFFDATSLSPSLFLFLWLRSDILQYVSAISLSTEVDVKWDPSFSKNFGFRAAEKN